MTSVSRPGSAAHRIMRHPSLASVWRRETGDVRWLAVIRGGKGTRGPDADLRRETRRLSTPRNLTTWCFVVGLW